MSERMPRHYKVICRARYARFSGGPVFLERVQKPGHKTTKVMGDFLMES